MPKRRYQCWNCRFIFTGHEVIPGVHDFSCPRCGAGCRKWLPTKEDKRKGSYHYDPASTLVLRVGRERQQLFNHGLYRMRQEQGEIKDVEVIDAIIPKFG